jgi:hypothetical protein
MNRKTMSGRLVLLLAIREACKNAHVAHVFSTELTGLMGVENGYVSRVADRESLWLWNASLFDAFTLTST